MAYRVRYVHDLYLHGLESSLPDRMTASRYPECAATTDDLLAVRKATVLVACGHRQVRVEAAGLVLEAAELVDLLDLQDYVEAGVKRAPQLDLLRHNLSTTPAPTPRR